MHQDNVLKYLNYSSYIPYHISSIKLSFVRIQLLKLRKLKKGTGYPQSYNLPYSLHYYSH